jgi:HAMP domain-containing protein
MEAFFYASIAVCGLLVVFRTLVFVVRVYLIHHPKSLPKSAGSFTKTHGAETGSETVPTHSSQPFQPFVQANEEAKSGGVRAHSEHAPAIPRYSFWFIAAFYRSSLIAKMTIAFSAVIVTFGLLTIATVYFMLASSLRSHISERARITAFAISQRVPTFFSKKNIAGLRAFLHNYVGQAGIAYVLVENRAGVILAHSFAVLPEEFQRASVPQSMQEGRPRVLKVGQRAVHEVSVAVLDGKVGAVRLGIWRDDFNAEVFQAVMPLIKLILLVVGLSIILVMYLAWKLNRPIVKLVEAAKSINTGVFDSPALDVDDPTELGALSRALERLRSSIYAARNRLTSER